MARRCTARSNLLQYVTAGIESLDIATGTATATWPVDPETGVGRLQLQHRADARRRAGHRCGVGRRHHRRATIGREAKHILEVVVWA